MSEYVSQTSPCYCLSSDEISSLTKELLSIHASDLPVSKQIITFEIDGSDKFSNVGRHIERQVFEETFGNDVQVMNDEYGPYELGSRFFIAIDIINEKPIGALRAISNSRQGLKTLNDAQEEFNIEIRKVLSYHNINELASIWDVGTTAVLTEYRMNRQMPSIRLYRAMYVSALKNGIEHLISIIDDKLLRILKGRLAIPFVPLASSSPRPYLGSEKSHAVYAFVPEFFDTMSKYLQLENSRFGKGILRSLVNGIDDDSIILASK